MNKFLFAIIFSVISTAALAQVRQNQQVFRSSNADTLSYLNPKEYIIGGITITGTVHLDKDVLAQIAKVNKGDKLMLPGEASAAIVKNLYKENLFDDVQLYVTKISLDTVYLEIAIKELPRLSNLRLSGLRKSEIEEINKKLDDKGKIVNTNLLNKTDAVIKKYLHEKGYLNAAVTIKQRPDPGDANSLILDVVVDKGRKVMINSVTFEGNKDFSQAKLKSFLSKTRTRKFYNIFGSKKFKDDKYIEDKQTLVEKMQARGYRDASVISDTVTKHDYESVDVKIKVYEGHKYYFGNIKWSGNARYNDDFLNRALRIKKGDVFSEETLSKRLSGGGPSGDDVSSLYLDDGYLTYNSDPVQTGMHNDTVDLDIRIFEGPQYTINRVTVKGNDVTNDRVVIRELQTLPGQKFRKSALIESTRIIGQLGNFDDTKTEPRPVNINSADGTVDLIYNVVEKPSDQVELSGGFGGGQFVGTLGLTFNNFAIKNIFHLKRLQAAAKR
jgi:outer membrane protein insertion porin family